MIREAIYNRLTLNWVSPDVDDPILTYDGKALTYEGKPLADARNSPYARYVPGELFGLLPLRFETPRRIGPNSMAIRTLSPFPAAPSPGSFYAARFPLRGVASVGGTITLRFGGDTYSVDVAEGVFGFYAAYRLTAFSEDLYVDGPVSSIISAGPMYLDSELDEIEPRGWRQLTPFWLDEETKRSRDMPYEPWLRAYTRLGPGKTATLGATLTERSGALYGQIFAPLNQGTLSSDEYAILFGRIFANRRLPGERCWFDAYNLYETERDGRWIQTMVEVPFVCEE